MDKQTADIIKDIIDLDCTMTGRFADGNGNFCFVGGLLATIDPDWAVSPFFTDTVFTTDMLLTHFGIEREFLQGAVKINDNHSARPARVAALKAHVDAHTDVS